MAKQPPLSPSRNSRDVNSRIKSGVNGAANLLSASQQSSSYARSGHQDGGAIRGIHSPDGMKVNDSGDIRASQQY